MDRGSYCEKGAIETVEIMQWTLEVQRMGRVQTWCSLLKRVCEMEPRLMIIFVSEDTSERA